MLWTLGGLWLLFGLGVVVGVCFTQFVTATVRQSERRWWMLLCTFVAVWWVLYLIIDWCGPAGGGG